MANRKSALQASSRGERQQGRESLLTHDGLDGKRKNDVGDSREGGRRKLASPSFQTVPLSRAQDFDLPSPPTLSSPSSVFSSFPLEMSEAGSPPPAAPIAGPSFREPIKTPIQPDTVSFSSQSFHTLTREAAFLHPPTNKSDIPALDELVAPHIESFNALLEDPVTGKGLLALAVDDIGAKVVFDGKKPGQGNRLSSESVPSSFS